MISDRYILKPYPKDVERLLDITEHMAACYGFSAKELLLIRLIAEEMILSIRSGLLLTPGELWFAAENGMFMVTASVGTDVYGLPKEQRSKLLNIAERPKKSGLLGAVQEFMEFSALADGPVNLHGFIDEHYGQKASGADEWHLDGDSLIMAGSGEEEFNPELSLLKGFADEIRVVGKGRRLEISVMKKIHFNFMFDYISDGTK